MSERRIHLLRHGETAWNAARIVQTPEVPLSARGIEQAQQLAARLAGRGIGLVLASDLARALGTAEPLCAATGAPLEVEPLLQERNFGAIGGTPYVELGFDLFAAGYAPPQGESWSEFHARVELAWARIIAVAGRTRGSLAVVTHGLVCSRIAARHLRLPRGADPGRGFANASRTEIEAEPPWTVLVYNCTDHLLRAAGDASAPA